MTLLWRLAAEGKTAEEIARVLGRTVTAIRIKAAQERVTVTLSGRQRPPSTQDHLPPFGDGRTSE